MTNQKSKTNKVLKAIEKQGFHVKNVTHLGGYFIFDHGKDMVVHFHIKECKGWLFGIWWDLEDKNRFTFFTQFEKTIDKFKPSASTYVVEDMTFSKDIDEEVEFKLKKILNFIKKHKYQAWYHDNCYTSNIWDMVSDSEAWRAYVKFIFKEKKRESLLKRVNKRWLKITNKICKELLPDYEIIDENIDGMKCYPRYMVVCKNDGTNGGHFAIDLQSELSKKMFRKTKKFDKQLERLRKKGYYLSEVDSFDGILPYHIRGKKKC